MKKSQITLTTNSKLKDKDTFYFNRMGLSLAGAIKTFLYKVYYNGGHLPYELYGGVREPGYDDTESIIRSAKIADRGNHGKKHHLKNV